MPCSRPQACISLQMASRGSEDLIFLIRCSASSSAYQRVRSVARPLPEDSQVTLVMEPCDSFMSVDITLQQRIVALQVPTDRI